MKFLRMRGMPDQAQAMGAYLKAKLAKLAQEFSCIGEVRGRGLMLGMEIISPHHTDRMLDGTLARHIKRECFKQGVMVETGGRHGAVMRFLPALTITEREVDQAVERIHSALTACLKQHDLAAMAPSAA
jgi:diaminobutyrate-2-oxoglutarate transaminase